MEYQEGDIIEFTYKGRTYEGEIFIVNAYPTRADYDIRVYAGESVPQDTLFKHVPEEKVLRLAYRNTH